MQIRTWKLTSLLAVACSSCLAATQTEDHFEFPSNSALSISSIGYKLVYTDHGTNEDGLRRQRAELFSNHGSFLDAVDFYRSVSGSWSSNGRAVYINHYIGSNITDCVYSVSDGHFVSLTDLLLRRLRESRDLLPTDVIPSPDNSHFYLVCERWVNDGSIEFSVQGYFDTEVGAGDAFEFNLIYDLVQSVFSVI